LLARRSFASAWRRAFTPSQRRHDPAVAAKRLARRLEALGFDVSLTEKAA
jgi:hypothetical protein